MELITLGKVRSGTAERSSYARIAVCVVARGASGFSAGRSTPPATLVISATGRKVARRLAQNVPLAWHEQGAQEGCRAR